MKVRKELAGLTAAAMLTGCAAEKAPSIDEARQAIANRFTSCTIPEVVDTHTRSDGYVMPYHDVVRFNLELTQTNLASRALNAYVAQDAPVSWNRPRIDTRLVNLNSPNKLQDIRFESPTEPYELKDNQLHPSMIFSPRDDYDNGARFVVMVTTRASSNLVTEVGGLTCGTIIKKDGSWKLEQKSPDIPFYPSDPRYDF